MRRSFRADSAACTWAKRIISTLAGAGPCDQPAANDHIVPVEHRRLPRRRPGEGLAEGQHGGVRGGPQEIRHGHGARAIAKLHEQPTPVAQSTVHEGPHGDLAHVESLPAAHDDLVARRASLEHVQRVRRGDAQTAPLADRETPVAIMLAERTTRAIDDRAPARRHAALFEEALVTLDGEADFL